MEGNLLRNKEMALILSYKLKVTFLNTHQSPYLAASSPCPLRLYISGKEGQL
jgi:hypothetical protein